MNKMFDTTEIELMNARSLGRPIEAFQWRPSKKSIVNSIVEKLAEYIVRQPVCD